MNFGLTCLALGITIAVNAFIIALIINNSKEIVSVKKF
jgi:hypothetical protein